MWADYFRGEPRLHNLKRTTLIERIVNADERWIELAGVPGSGRSTLLLQIDEELRERGDAVGYVGATADVYSVQGLFERAGFRLLREPEDAQAVSEDGEEDLSLLRLAIEHRAADSSNGFYTLLVDDADWAIDHGIIATLQRLIQEAGKLRLVTVTLTPIHGIDNQGVNAAQRLWITTSDLGLSATEIALLRRSYLRSAGMDPDPDEAAAIPVLRAATAGFPLAVGLALDRTTHGEREQSASGLALALTALRVEIQRRYPEALVYGSVLSTMWVMSFLPRFTLTQMRDLVPNVSAEDVRQITEIGTIDQRKSILPGEFVWADQVWQAFEVWNQTDSGMRATLATRMEEAGDTTGAFQQWLLGGAYTRAEQLLRRRFFTIFEGLAPEGVQCIRGLGTKELRDYPRLRVMAMLLNPHASAEEIAIGADNLQLQAQKASATGQRVLALAVRAAVLVRLQKTGPALVLANEVLTCRIEDIVDPEDVLSAAEARLLAFLVHFSCNSRPEDRIVLGQTFGETILDRRGETAQRLMDVLRQGSDEDRDALPHRPYSYRALLYPDAEAHAEISAWRELDRQLLEHRAPVAELDRPSEKLFTRGQWLDHPLPTMLREWAMCAGLLLVGNIGDAVTRNARLPQPLSGVFGAVIALAKGDVVECLSRVDGISGRWGVRIDACVAVLRAVALIRSGRLEAGQRSLAEVQDLPRSSLLMIAGALTRGDLESLARASTSFAPIAAQAVVNGFLNSGFLLSEGYEFQPLTKREREILRGISQGHSTKRIAEEHFLSVNTVKTHTLSLSRKLKASGRAEILRRATEIGLL